MVGQICGCRNHRYGGLIVPCFYKEKCSPPWVSPRILISIFSDEPGLSVYMTQDKHIVIMSWRNKNIQLGWLGPSTGAFWADQWWLMELPGPSTGAFWADQWWLMELGHLGMLNWHMWNHQVPEMIMGFVWMPFNSTFVSAPCQTHIFIYRSLRLFPEYFCLVEKQYQ